MAAIPIERIVRIADTSDAGQFVPVHDDQKRTGGVLAFQQPAPDIFPAPGLSDSWIQGANCVDAFFSNAGWTVERQRQMAAR